MKKYSNIFLLLLFVLFSACSSSDESQGVVSTKDLSSDTTVTITPRIGDFYFFPHYLMHTVFPFKGTDEERRSISFNAFIDENLYNVYRD